MRLVILGTGNMAASHAAHFHAIEDVEIVGAVDLDEARVQKFAHDYNIPNVFTSLEEAIAWGDFDSIANVTPDRFHYETSMQAIAARSEEHTSELQSRPHLVCRLLLEKK